MSINIFFISTMVVISLIYYHLLKFFSYYYKSKFARWFYFFVISAGTFIVNCFAFRGLSGIEKTEYSIFYPIGITVLMLIIRGFYKILLNPSFSFLSTKDESEQYSIYPVRKYKKVAELDSDKIAIYPRITIRDIEIEDMWENEKKVKNYKMSEVSDTIKELYDSNHIIFDSSDFVVINKTFGAFDNLQESFTVGNKIKFKDKELLSEKVQVDFMNIYDDYSGGIIRKHTKEYEGKDTPYHIQIIVWARRIKEN